jgi:hypothetical protein
VVIVTAGMHVVLDVEFAGLRRIQFDLERSRPATLVIVPHRPGQSPQLLAIPHGEIGRVAEALTLVGNNLAALD